MNLAALDPKLLSLLDAVLDETHLARAAARVGLPLAAAAAALERCRQLFADPLLEDGGQAMQLTATAQALREPLRQVLAARTAQAATEAALPRQVRIAMPDYPAQMLAQPLYEELSASAPHLEIVFQPWLNQADAASALETGTCDVAIGSVARTHGNLRSREVLQERCVVVMRHDHPAAHQLTLQRWLTYPHLVVSSLDELNRAVDTQLAAHGQTRRVAMVVPQFLMVPPLLHNSDLIAMMPMHCVPAATAAHPVALACLRPPLPLPGLPLHLLRHRRSDGDDAVEQVAQALERLIKSRVAGR
ncbi:LysR family transcriptional regulator [Herbaspirillum sp. alder98]|uniref:LysR family transcriptional regulator n=1 Tax=Herbaspirillum sp. alder98 TaxID=2913096 RepID=UPI001CD84BB5|nr:LysR family transcriptional regulator [Herbaspirillum sp. alder98]MCA1324641.1 LysR family transcriptional regulator [Herbaspirillum sp. alder98]